MLNHVEGLTASWGASYSLYGLVNCLRDADGRRSVPKCRVSRGILRTVKHRSPADPVCKTIDFMNLLMRGAYIKGHGSLRFCS